MDEAVCSDCGLKFDMARAEEGRCPECGFQEVDLIEELQAGWDAEGGR